MSQLYLMTCAACGHTIPVGIGKAGQSILCQCGQDLQVPLMRDLRRLPPAEIGSSPLVPQGASVTPARVIFAASFLVLIIAALVGSFFAYQRSHLSTARTPDVLIQHESEGILKLKLNESMEAWDYFNKSGLHGLEQMPELMANKQNAIVTIQMMVAFVIAGVCLVSVVVAGVLSGRDKKSVGR